VIPVTEYETAINLKGSTNVWWKEGEAGFDLSVLDKPQEVVMELTDPETFEIFRARVRICSVESALSEPNILKLFNHESMGGRDKEPVARIYVEIVERIEEPEVQVKLHREKQRFAQMRGEVLKTLLAKDKKDD